MSLLRDVLRKNNFQGGSEPPNELARGSRANLKKNYAASIRSSGGASIRSVANSIASFYSTITGTRIAKRRRPDVSNLGVPKWYRGDPPPAPDMPGTARAEKEGHFTAAHATSLPVLNEETPWLSVVLYNYSSEASRIPRYFNDAKIHGELRMILKRPKSVASVDVWCVGKAESVLELGGAPFLQMHANLWKRAKGDPRNPNGTSDGNFKGKFPDGSFVFPFEFPAFPRDIDVELPPESTDREVRPGLFRKLKKWERFIANILRQHVTRVVLPPSCQFGSIGGFKGAIQYYIGVNLKVDDLIGVNEEFDVPFSYYQCAHPLPREISPFPFIPTREDWPFRREVLGGWTLTPFGGRGRFDDEAIEVEGILGVQTPEVYAAGQVVRFSLLLWSTSPVALQELSRAKAFDVVLIRSDLYGTDVLKPRNSSRRNRTPHKLSQGRIWRTDDGPPLDDAMSQSRPFVATSDAAGIQQKVETSMNVTRRTVVSRFQQSFTAEDIAAVEKQDSPPLSEVGSVQNNGDKLLDEPTLAEEGDQGERASSPTPSLENSEEEDIEDTIRMDGDVRVVWSLPPSFRYKYMGCEYSLQLTINHPRYSHISPSGPGIQAETPIWVVTEPPETPQKAPHRPETRPDMSALSEVPITGQVADIGAGAIRAPATLGEVTTKDRPTWRNMRLSSY